MVNSLIDIITDTESGGFSEKKNPLLSVGMYVVDANRNILAKDYFRILPPAGTAVEVAPLKWQDAFTGQETAPVGWKIEAGAIGVNGYCKGSCPPVWHLGALGYREAVARLTAFLQPYEGAAKFYAHNAPFDRRFMPAGWWKQQDWSCTMTAIKRYQRANGLEENGKLSALRKFAGVEVHDDKLEHTALQDAYDAMHGLWALRDAGHPI